MFRNVTGADAHENSFRCLAVPNKSYISVSMVNVKVNDSAIRKRLARKRLSGKKSSLSNINVGTCVLQSKH